MLPGPDPLRSALEAIQASDPMRERKLIAAYLFGSQARDQGTAASDIDLGLLTRPPLGLERARLMDIAARAAGREVDVVDLGTAPPELAWEVLTTGRLLLEGDEHELSQFLRHARFAAEDAAQRDRMVLIAQVGSVGGRTR